MDHRSILVASFPILALSACTLPVLQMQPNIPNGGRAVAIAVHPTNGSRMIVASETGGLFRTTDGGVNWAQVSGNSTFGYSDVLYLPTNPNVIIATAYQDMRVQSGGGVWRSTDGGDTWSRVALTPPTTICATDLAAFALAYEAASSRLWVGTSCGLASSTDGGVTWQYLSAAPGYDNVAIFAVLAPAANQLKILTDAGVRVSTNGGTSWTVSNTGLPSNIIKGVHNQIAVSPFDANHLYWAFNYWFWNATTNNWEGKRALYKSTDNGANWSSIIDEGGINRPPFVKLAQSSLGGGANKYDMYFSNGSCGLQRAVVTHGTSPTLSVWTPLNLDHCDPAELGLGIDHVTPVLLLSDGGLHATTDAGLHWTLTGASGHGYGALQITEVTGQLHSAGSSSNSDLYFGTQDNDVWASVDGGLTWTGQICCEGFFLNVWRDPLPPSQTKVTGVTCGACFNFMSDPALAAAGGFPNPPNDNGNPRLIAPGSYVHSTSVPGLTGNIFDVSTNNGGAWTPRYGFPEPVRDLSRTAGSAGDPVVFTAVKRPGSTPDGNEILGIKRITEVLGSGTPVVFDITGYGSLGIFPTMFAWYKPFGVDPGDPQHLMVSDIIDGLVKVSRDGGGTWQPDTILTRLVTESGSLRFKSGPFTQISTFGFDPTCLGHVVVGTVQAGVFQSFDNGGTWEFVTNSDIVPSVSSFFFPVKGRIITSSYGRGLWSIFYKCPPPRPRPPFWKTWAEPTIFWKGGRVPISQLHNPDACPVCTFMLMEQGRILDYVLDAASGKLQEVRLSGGQLRGYTWARTPVDVPFRTSMTQLAGAFGGDTALAAIFKREPNVQVKGLFVEGSLLRGVILATEDVTPSQIPEKQVPAPEIRVDVPGTGGTPIERAGQLVLHGTGFEPDIPIEVQLDGVVLRLEQAIRPDGKGAFTLKIPPLGLGGHTVLVRQRTARGIRQDAHTFNITVRDTARQR